MTAQALLDGAIWLALALLGLSFFATAYRVITGPTLADRVVGLDMLVGIAIGFIAVIAVKTGFTLYIDVAIALGLVGFLATVAFARFILSRKTADEQGALEPNQGAERGVQPATTGKGE
ncbi:cation:proton antiporter [Rhizobium sp. SL86]|jgi:multicomponent Na+:H+ antiporter subunit F|uniref:cation:proton antiporter n=1 Tax=Rhizobium sp. SL86 TaxID=2995148 RepID=UPI002275CA12|nr:cation:proton antiporter [Rhizobium sp. SL86]MCY1664217.1 cation:proton antiporter [Rhizobium sp. SL86]